MLNRCTWPALSAPYDQALHEVVEFILSHFEVSGIIASGTIIRGNPDPQSDLDVYAIHKAPYRQRIQKFFNDVPVEIFVNPVSAIERYFVEENKAGRPLTAHMLATGFVIMETDGIVTELRKRAQVLLTEPFNIDTERITIARYMIATLFEDAVDVAHRDPATANMLLSQAVAEMLKFFFTQSGRFIPRHKDILAAVHGVENDVGEMAMSFFGTADIVDRLRFAEKIADKTIGVRGFFEWESAPEKVEQ